MPRSLARFPRLLTGFAFPQTAIAGEGWHTSFLGPLSEPIWRWLDSPAMLPAIAIAVAVIGLCVLVAGNLRVRRRHARLAISGLRNGARFRVVDAMCSALVVTTPLCSFHTAPAQSGFMLALLAWQLKSVLPARMLL